MKTYLVIYRRLASSALSHLAFFRSIASCRVKFWHPRATSCQNFRLFTRQARHTQSESTFVLQKVLVQLQRHQFPFSFRKPIPSLRGLFPWSLLLKPRCYVQFLGCTLLCLHRSIVFSKRCCNMSWLELRFPSVQGLHFRQQIYQDEGLVDKFCTVCEAMGDQSRTLYCAFRGN